VAVGVDPVVAADLGPGAVVDVYVVPAADRAARSPARVSGSRGRHRGVGGARRRPRAGQFVGASVVLVLRGDRPGGPQVSGQAAEQPGAQGAVQDEVTAFLEAQARGRHSPRRRAERSARRDAARSDGGDRRVVGGDLVAALERRPVGVTVVRRCVDLADLLAAAASGTARAALLSADLRRLDREALARLAAAGVAVVGLYPPGDETSERRLRPARRAARAAR
jgi:hypothetical protein